MCFETMKLVQIFTDGACRGNPGPGGWAAILQYKNLRREISGGEEMTTNNRMELTAAVRAFALLKEPCRVKFASDSQYVLNGLSKGWAENWKARGWRRADREPALNADLWDALLTATAPHKIEYIWLKGHAGHPENERCDFLAVAEAAKFGKPEEAPFPLAQQAGADTENGEKKHG